MNASPTPTNPPSPPNPAEPAAAHPELTADSLERAQAERLHAHADLPGQHRGMPAYEPQTERTTTGEPHTPLDASVKESIELPHQRDQHVAMTSGEVDPMIRQAGADLAEGKQDTTRAVEVDRTYHDMRPGKP